MVQQQQHQPKQHKSNRMIYPNLPEQVRTLPKMVHVNGAMDMIMGLDLMRHHAFVIIRVSKIIKIHNVVHLRRHDGTHQKRRRSNTLHPQYPQPSLSYHHHHLHHHHRRRQHQRQQHHHRLRRCRHGSTHVYVCMPINDKQY
jgi:hypothetical protein